MKELKIAVCLVVILLLAANLYMSFQLQSKVNQLQVANTPKKSLPCESVPISWAVKNYECANSLLLAMNVTKVKFEPPGTVNELLYNRAKQISTP